MATLFGLVAGIAAIVVLMCLGCYRLGYNDCLAMGKSKPLEPILSNPITNIQEKRETKKAKVQEDAIIQGINNIFSFDGTPQAEVK